MASIFLWWGLICMMALPEFAGGLPLKLIGSILMIVGGILLILGR